MPEQHEKTSPALSPTNHDGSGKRERFSRSPHPYRRRGNSLLQSNEASNDASSPCPVVAVVPSETEKVPATTYFDADHRKRRKENDTASESGTEADDEKETFLLGLPAPPARPRKGFKGARDPGSPLLTPSYLDDEDRKSALEATLRRRSSLQSQSADEEASKVRAKFRSRRRAELIRRITETALFLSICYFGTGAHQAWPMQGLLQQDNSLSSIRIQHGLQIATQPIPLFAAVISTLYASYPVRIIYHNQNLSLAKQKSRFYIHLPAAFDPAPLLYPVVLPAIAAWSIGQDNAKLLLPNLILGISSIPSKIIPFGNTQWSTSPQWLLSMLPLWDLRRWRHRYTQDVSSEYLSFNGFDDLVLLYPLHQTLLPVLQYLTTTSLLPTELQLLSTALINLLLLSKSPQAVILQILLWMGGIALLVLCGKVLRWGVSIARIPSWRFSKPRHRSSRNKVALSAVKDTLYSLFRTSGSVSQSADSSDEEEGDRPTPMRHSGRRLTKIKTIDLDLNHQNLSRHNSTNISRSGKGYGKGQPLPMTKDDLEEPRPLSQRHRRSNTLPTRIDSSKSESTLPNFFNTDASLFHSRKGWSFKSLTSAQATVLRWMFALYAYVVVVVLIAFPLRVFISRHAFHGLEPVGWALGYLFGDLSRFRSLVEERKMDSWVPLPATHAHHTLYTEQTGQADAYRDYIGPANTRLLLCAYCLAVIAFGLASVLRLSAVAEVDTRRKVFHGMMVAMFLPTVFVDPAFVSLALILVLIIFLILDLLRASQLPPVAKPLTYFLAPYVDGRDHRGPVIVSHIFLLIGCAIPLWLSLAAAPRTGQWPWEGWEVPSRDLSMVSGVVCVGMGDAAASLIGRRYGRRRWCWTGGKSLEGSLAFAIAVMIGLSVARIWLLIGGWEGDSGDSDFWFTAKAGVAAAGASLTEAVLTGGNDNVIVPIVLWLLVRGLGV